VSGFAFDSNIVIDALRGFPQAHRELRRGRSMGGRLWVSRLVWTEVMSKGSGEALSRAQYFLTGFGIDEIDEEVSARAALLRRERPRLKLPDAIILASALTRGRILVTRNTKDFPVDMPGVRIPYLRPEEA
jgi:predicted nucleic acid-binding protein